MDVQEKRKELAALLARNEEALAELYRAYAAKFPKFQEFWSELAEEEMEHSRLIHTLFTQDKGAVFFREEIVKMELVRTSLKYLKDKLAQVHHEQMSLTNALTVALGLETGMLEREYFAISKEAPVELKKILQDLAAVTEKHTNKLRELLAKRRN